MTAEWLVAVAAVDVASVPVPVPPPPLRLFKDTVPESSSRSIKSIKSSSWWEAPARSNEIPRWAIGHTVAVNTAGGLALSAGFFGRRADPLPLFLSSTVSERAGDQIMLAPEQPNVGDAVNDVGRTSAFPIELGRPFLPSEGAEGRMPAGRHGG